MCRTRSRILQALGGKMKYNSAKEVLGKNNNFYRKWIEFHFTPEMN